jgi:hypothetical protein
MTYALSVAERTRLLQAVRAALTVPLIAGVEGYVREAIFHYIKGLPLPDPHSNIRKKLLFDAVDEATGIGWSLKAVQKTPQVGANIEVVIQRADVLKKRIVLGFPKLTLKSDPQTLGAAVLTHWQNKVAVDCQIQAVSQPHVAVLVKSRDHRHYALIEQRIAWYERGDLLWSWTDAQHKGLQAKHQTTGTIIYRWYPNQKQFFEVFTLSADCFLFDVDSTRLDPVEFIKLLAGVAK